MRQPLPFIHSYLLSLSRKNFAVVYQKARRDGATRREGLDNSSALHGSTADKQTRSCDVDVSEDKCTRSSTTGGRCAEWQYSISRRSSISSIFSRSMIPVHTPTIAVQLFSSSFYDTRYLSKVTRSLTFYYSENRFPRSWNAIFRFLAGTFHCFYFPQKNRPYDYGGRVGETGYYTYLTQRCTKGPMCGRYDFYRISVKVVGRFILSHEYSAKNTLAVFFKKKHDRKSVFIHIFNTHTTPWISKAVFVLFPRAPSGRIASVHSVNARFDPEAARQKHLHITGVIRFGLSLYTRSEHAVLLYVTPTNEIKERRRCTQLVRLVAMSATQTPMQTDLFAIRYWTTHWTTHRKQQLIFWAMARAVTRLTYEWYAPNESLIAAVCSQWFDELNYSGSPLLQFLHMLSGHNALYLLFQSLSLNMTKKNSTKQQQ